MCMHVVFCMRGMKVAHVVNSVCCVYTVCVVRM